MRALVVLNENPLGSHPDLYEAFDTLVAQGLLDGYDVYPFLHHVSHGAREAEVARDILRMAADGDHELIIWMHTGRLRISDADLQALTGLPSRPTVVYWEGDTYHPFYKPIPTPMLTIMARCRAAFLSSGGYTARRVLRAGCGTALYAPNCASPRRFPYVWRADGDLDHDVVMIGNLVRSRVPFRTMPGARRRAHLARVLERRYGARFAVYGEGWSGRSAMGPCRFDDQSSVYARSKVAVGIDNLVAPYFFSDRPPIAMACGIPFLNSRGEDYDEVFGTTLRDMFFADEGELTGLIDRLISMEPPVLAQIGARNREFFERNLTMVEVARHVVTESFRLRRGEPRRSEGAAPLSGKTGDPLGLQIPDWQRIPPLGGKS